MYYPKHFKTNDNENFNIIFKDQLKARIDTILNPDEKNKEMLYELGRQMLEMRKPNVWNVFQVDNMEIMMEVDFEKFLIAVSEHTNEKIDEMSTFRFYALIDFLKEKYKPTK